MVAADAAIVAGGVCWWSMGVLEAVSLEKGSSCGPHKLVGRGTRGRSGFCFFYGERGIFDVLLVLWRCVCGLLRRCVLVF